VAKAILQAGAQETTQLSNGMTVPDCVFSATVHVPLTTDKYRFAIGSSNSVSQSMLQLSTDQWVVKMQTGTGIQTVSFTEIDYDGNCASDEASDPMNLGTPVKVTGDAGTVIATGALENPTDGSALLTDGTAIADCTFYASIVVPVDQNSYTFTVGTSNPVADTRAYLSSNGWSENLVYNQPNDLAS
jgi:hypothetical protein